MLDHTTTKEIIARVRSRGMGFPGSHPGIAVLAYYDSYGGQHPS